MSGALEGAGDGIFDGPGDGASVGMEDKGGVVGREEMGLVDGSVVCGEFVGESVGIEALGFCEGKVVGDKLGDSVVWQKPLITLESSINSDLGGWVSYILQFPPRLNT